MSTRLTALASLVALMALPLATGCVVVHKGEGAKEKKEAVQYPATTADDRPAGYQETAGAGFWVWRGPKGGWHVRTTSGGKEHHFHGEIAVRGSGLLTELKANRTELNDRVKGNPSGAAFEFKTSTFEDGIDFRVDPGNCIEFDLKIDGKSQPDKINLGGGQAHPDSHWFKLCD
jgi:hypothetical protein